MSERNDPAPDSGEIDWTDDQVDRDPEAGFDTASADPESGTALANGGAGALRDLVTFLVHNLVDDPDAVRVDVEQRGSLVQIQLRLPEEELGKVIGRGGRIAKSMRTALMIAGSRHHLRVSLDIEG